MSNNVVNNLKSTINEGFKIGWPNEAEIFSKIVSFCLDKWEKENFPQTINYNCSELANYLNLSSAESARNAFDYFQSKIGFIIEIESHYICEIIGDPANPDEIREISIKDGYPRKSSNSFFAGRSVLWNGKNGEETIDITLFKEFLERVKNEDLDIFWINIFTPYNYNDQKLFEWLETEKSVFALNANEPRKEVRLECQNGKIKILKK